MATPTVSYAQRFEDLYLMRCFAGDSDGFYIDIGSGHPVYDNTSFAFYLKGWHGITVEPNPRLARLTRAVRPRDRHVEALVGAALGEATFYLVDDLHGFSTMIESHARAAQTQFGKSSQAIPVPVTTLKDLCRQHAPPAFDFLKVDVEGAEQEVLLNGDWQNYRQKVVVAEALALNELSARDLKAVASVMGVRSNQRTSRDALAHQIATKITNTRGYRSLRDGAE